MTKQIAKTGRQAKLATKKGIEPIFAPARARRTFDDVVKQIQDGISEGRLTRGDKLPTERELAAQFQVSRSTVREALRMLEIGGYITLRRGSAGGAFISETDPKKLNHYLTGALRVTDISVADLTQSMYLISMMLLSAAAENITKADLDAMEADVREAEKVIDDPLKRSSIMIRFYHQLAVASGNKILVAIADVLVEILDQWVVRLGSLSGDRIIRSRLAVIENLRAGNIDRAREQFAAYLQDLHDVWLKGQQ
ncbi:MAG: FadR family transcriptional regulator [Rhodobiaceae bacterium]|nr:FadR family transcriptional regulator [Rhodobiaceae bacterium]MCC0056263.1 FadR family transcriptional regulator [Rhodobiaceae bacterium]